MSCLLMLCAKQSRHPASGPWIPDDQTNSCMLCDNSFSFFSRRHHCRACGSIVCHSCSSRSEFLPQYGYSLRHPVRICDHCAQKSKTVIDLEKELFIISKKSKYRKSDIGVFLVEFASKLRMAKCAESISEYLLSYAVSCFVKLFMSLYEPVNHELSEILKSTSDDIPEDRVDDALDRAMYLLRSWKNLENDLPGISAKAFLNRVELVERWRLGVQTEPSPTPTSGMHRVTSTPNLSHAAASFHRHRSNEGFSALDEQEKRKVDEKDLEQSSQSHLKPPGKTIRRSVSTHDNSSSSTTTTIVIGLRA